MAVHQGYEPLMATYPLSQAPLFFSMVESSERLKHDQCQWTKPLETESFQCCLAHP